MSERVHEQTTETTAPQEAQKTEKIAIPPSRQMALGGSAVKQAETLHRTTSGRLHRAGETLLQLQRQYGNQHVQRVAQHAQNLGEQNLVVQRQPNNSGLFKKALDQVGGGAQKVDKIQSGLTKTPLFQFDKLFGVETLHDDSDEF